MLYRRLSLRSCPHECIFHCVVKALVRDERYQRGWTMDINIKQIPEENKIFNRKSIELKFQ
ncbi:hypothetical protein A6J89_005765 [Pasteurella multocida]|nr:hypothetical protein A6J89_005765 [Pasteurella multocida]